MKSSTPSLSMLAVLIAALASLASPLACDSFAQSGRPPQSSIRPPATVSALEAEIFRLLEANEGLHRAIANRHEELNVLVRDRSAAEGRDRDRVLNRINTINDQNRTASTQISLNQINIQRYQLEIDRLSRLGDAGWGGISRPPVTSAPQVRSIEVLRTSREGPVRVQGQGQGFHVTTVYEVVFSNGSRQRVEQKRFVPSR